MINMLDFQHTLATLNGYRPLSNQKSKEVREYCLNQLPSWCNITGDNISLFTMNKTMFALGYDRIVIGDYGAFIEYSFKHIIEEVYKVQEGQEYRFEDAKYKDNVKYYWSTINDFSGIKIYYQQKTVTYADYIPQKFYVSPYEVQQLRK